MKVICQLQYHGGFASGWGEQPSEVSIAGSLKKALEELTGFDVGLACAGRTDKGVHAVGQIASFDAPVERPLQKWKTGLNHFLPHFIRVDDVSSAAENFHPRYAALARTYRYYCHVGLQPLSEGLITLLYKKPNIHLMNQAAYLLLGKHNFTSFRGGSCQAKTPIKTCFEALWTQHDRMLCFQIKADAFLHHMVRYLVGCMLEVGYGHKSLDWFSDLLSKQHHQDYCAPPEGLYFCHAHYPDRWNLPFTDRRPWFDQHRF